MIEILNGIFYDPKDGLPYSKRIRGTHLTRGPYKKLTTTSSKGYLQVWDAPDQTHKLWHRLVYEHFNGPIDKGMVVDHIDGNKLNNLVDNLRVVTYSLNSGKAKQRTNSTGYAGVSKTKHGKFMAKIKVNAKSINLGHFNTPQEAYEVYKQAKIKYFGEESLLHLP